EFLDCWEPNDSPGAILSKPPGSFQAMRVTVPNQNARAHRLLPAESPGERGRQLKQRPHAETPAQPVSLILPHPGHPAATALFVQLLERRNSTWPIAAGKKRLSARRRVS